MIIGQEVQTHTYVYAEQTTLYIYDTSKWFFETSVSYEKQ